MDLSFLESWNLIPAYVVVTFLACGLALDNVVLRANGRLGRQDDDLVVHWAHRIALLVLALTFLLSLSYATQKGWQPWAPDLLMRFAICLWLLVSSVAVRLREHKITLIMRPPKDASWGFGHAQKRPHVKGFN